MPRPDRRTSPGVEQLLALPVHGPDGRIVAVRHALGLHQVEFARAIRERGGRVSRETVSHWENHNHDGLPRSRLTRSNARVVASLVRDKLGWEVVEEMFFEPAETAWDGVARRQLEMEGKLVELDETLRTLERRIDEQSPDKKEGRSIRNDIPFHRVALRPSEAAESLGVSRDFFDKEIKPELRLVRRGRLQLVPVKELERWAEANAETTL